MEVAVKSADDTACGAEADICNEAEAFHALQPLQGKYVPYLLWAGDFNGSSTIVLQLLRGCHPHELTSEERELLRPAAFEVMLVGPVGNRVMVHCVRMA